MSCSTWQWEPWLKTQLRSAEAARWWYYSYLHEPLIDDDKAIMLMGKAAADYHYHAEMARWWQAQQAAGRDSLTTVEVSRHSAKLRRQIKGEA